MDSLLTAAARALANGDALGALTRVALRDDAPALALRGIAMARIGDLDRARALLRQAARSFGPGERLARARCIIAEAEIALVTRDLSWPMDSFHRARATLAELGDLLNATHAAILEARRLLLLGHLDAAEAVLGEPYVAPLPPTWQASRELVRSGIAMRRLHTAPAAAALEHAASAAALAGIPALQAEVDAARLQLERPVARLIGEMGAPMLRLADLEALLASDVVIVDAGRNMIQHRDTSVALATRPVLFMLARLLAEAWPADVSRAALIARAFRGRDADESHRARLRVEIGRLRVALRPLASVVATRPGFALRPRAAAKVVVVAPPDESRHAAVLALLADGEAWSSSALAIALGTSARTVQRALEQLAAEDRVQHFGRGRARRWLTPPVPGFPTALLLPLPQRRP